MKGKKTVVLLASVFVVVALFPVSSRALADGLELELSCVLVGAGTPGYWKNHPEAWPGTVIWIGGRMYTREEAIALMGQPDKGDKTYTLFRALVAAKLNTEVNWAYRDPYWECIVETLVSAHGWMNLHPVGSGVKASSPAWKAAEPLYLALDAFNNGKLCMPSRDSLEADGLELELSCVLVGAGTSGYWKNHPEAWPGDVIWIGGRMYTRDEAIALMGQPDKGDKTYTLFRALVAAKLNTEVNWAFRYPYWDCIVETLAAASGWMNLHPVGSGVKASSAAWKTAEPLYLALDAFNNGEMCMPSRDSLEADGLALELSCVLVGAGTPGYWKNHPEAWPGTVIWIGGRMYTREEAIALMEEPVEGDKTYTLFQALVAAKLNTEVNWSFRDPYWECIVDTLVSASGWLNAHEVGSGVEASSPAWQAAEPLYLILDAFNNGEMCMPSRDSLEAD